MSGKDARTFAGFTFGGGGHTFSCEPATWDNSGGHFELLAGSRQDSTRISLRGPWDGQIGASIPLESGEIKADDQADPAQLISGTLIVQSRDDTITHGSFDLKCKTPDGREFPVIGSFTAKPTPRG